MSAPIRNEVRFIMYSLVAYLQLSCHYTLLGSLTRIGCCHKLRALGRSRANNRPLGEQSESSECFTGRSGFFRRLTAAPRPAGPISRSQPDSGPERVDDVLRF